MYSPRLVSHASPVGAEEDKGGEEEEGRARMNNSAVLVWPSDLLSKENLLVVCGAHAAGLSARYRYNGLMERVLPFLAHVDSAGLTGEQGGKQVKY